MQKINPIPFTKEGYEKLKVEQEKLLVERKDALEHLKKAREMGDLSENGYYKASRFKLNSIDSRLRQLKFQIRYGKITTATSAETVTIGCSVEISDGKKTTSYAIVGGYESNPADGKISHVSPLGKALLGKKVGDDAILTAPAGKVIYKIVKITT